MPRPKIYLRRMREDQIKEQQERAIERGLLHRVTVDGEGDHSIEVWRNRTLIQACEWRIEQCAVPKKKIVRELKARRKFSGKREIVRLERAIEHFSKG